jgi:hypothetical protein
MAIAGPASLAPVSPTPEFRSFGARVLFPSTPPLTTPVRMLVSAVSLVPGS